MPEYLVRFVQMHETFRRPELEALAHMAGLELEIVDYHEDSPFCILRLQSSTAAIALVSRSILSYAIYELWGTGSTYDALHASVRAFAQHMPPVPATASFSFQIDSFQGKRSNADKARIVDSFSYLAFAGRVKMRAPDLAMLVLEDYALDGPAPRRLHLGRLLAPSARAAVGIYDLKKRSYISTTSMDSELALLTANLALARPGKLFYDPFTGTGSFPIACAHFGALVLGSDIDGRSIRGPKGKHGRNVVGNFAQYGLLGRYLDGFVSDLTNSPLRRGRWLDGVVCDPPYGVREGLKVLGSTKEELQREVRLADGSLAHLNPDYIPPKKAYSFETMLADILDFAAEMLVDGGRLCMWMPTANDEDIELAIPGHPALRLVSVSVQEFNKWSRRLLAYSRIPDSEIDVQALQARRLRQKTEGSTASELNAFRRRYFQGFRDTDEKGHAVDG